MSSSLQKYRPLREIASNLYCVDGEWFDSPFGRRMTVIRLRDQSLVIHSAIQMSEEDISALEKLGKVDTVVVPNVFHDSEAKFYVGRFPQARVFVPAASRAKCERRFRVTGTLERDWPHQEEVPRITLERSMAGESVFIHRDSKSLIVTDLAFNVASSDFQNRLERLVFGKWNGIADQFGPSKLTKLVVARDRSAVMKFLAEVAREDFDRVVMSHGRIVETDGKRRFLEGYARVYGDGIRP